MSARDVPGPRVGTDSGAGRDSDAGGDRITSLRRRRSLAASPTGPSFCLVCFHAHPDDEALLTGGTIARARAEGHRVVIVCATDGALGMVSSGTATDGDLGRRRREELRAAARALGCGDVRFLGYADSGYEAPRDKIHSRKEPAGDGAGGAISFCDVPTQEAAEKLAVILRDLHADVLTVYDPAGGYGHPDHVAVHRVGIAAAALAGTRVVLEATVDRRALRRALGALRALGVTRALKVDGDEWDPRRFETAFADPRRITHRVRVGRYCRAKRNAMAAHASQATGDASVRTLAVFARLPVPVFRLVFAREWFVEIVPAKKGDNAEGPRSAAWTNRLSGDVFSSLRVRPDAASGAQRAARAGSGRPAGREA